MENNYERYYMLFKKEVSYDHQIKVKLITTDGLVQKVMDHVK